MPFTHVLMGSYCSVIEVRDGKWQYWARYDRGCDFQEMDRNLRIIAGMPFGDLQFGTVLAVYLILKYARWIVYKMNCCYGGGEA